MRLVIDGCLSRKSITQLNRRDMHARQQLPRTAGTHEVGEAVVGAGELVEGREANENHRQGVEAFRFVDGGVADGVARGLVEGFQIGPQRMIEQMLKAGERGVADLTAVVEDEHL